MITDDQVEEVRARAEIVDIVGEFVPLRKSGRSYTGKCPFHDDSSPSFSVVPGKGFHCFGCGESGDVFSFIMRKLGMDFPEAVRWVAGKVGVEIREVRRKEGEEDPWRGFWEVNAFARDFWQGRLADPEEGRGARDYLASRGIGAETIERFGIGFAPDDWRRLRDAAARAGFDDALLLEAGLITTREGGGGEPYDRFRNRIIFPIEGFGDRILAFGGRILPGAGGAKGEGAKYLNSPETPVYHKGEALYALPRARHAIRREEVVIVVEGYMDLVALHAAGFEHSVATLGTAFTPAQAGLLARYTRRALLLFDSDAAGQKATFRAGDTLLADGVHPSVVTLPPGEDPDSLLRGGGAEALRPFLTGAVDLLEAKLLLLESRGFLQSIEGTRRAVDRLLPTLRAVKDPTLRDLYVARVAARTSIRRETLEGEIERGSAAAARSGMPGGGTEPGRGDAEPAWTGVDGGWGGTDRPRGRGGRGGRGVPAAGGMRGRTLPTPRMGAERELLRLLVRDRDWIERAIERVGPEDFRDPAWRRVFEALLTDPELRYPPEEMDPGAALRLEELLADTGALAHPAEVFEAAVGRLLSEERERRLEELDRRLRDTRDPDEERLLLAERARVRGEGRAARPDWRPAARLTLRAKEEPTGHSGNVEGDVGDRGGPRHS